jgi:SAM-dependent methyltransferase
MDRDALLTQWRAEALAELDGWDFSAIAGRHVEDSPPWSYDALAREVLSGAGSALDMGTGGGELLLTLGDALPADTVANEGWPPNIPVAQRNLNPHDIAVVEYDADADDPTMPFPDARFDVVLNRHEAYRADEVLRILRPGGRFLTQQVDGRDFEETQALFGGHGDYPHITLANLRPEALDAGFDVERAEEWSGRSRFTDVGALVHYFSLVPWEVPEDFGVDRYADVLLDLHATGPARGEPITFTMRRFFLLARKPG